jgi:hypothetical protein
LEAPPKPPIPVKGFQGAVLYSCWVDVCVLGLCDIVKSTEHQKNVECLCTAKNFYKGFCMSRLKKFSKNNKYTKAYITMKCAFKKHK